jgi:hypothetical protein
MNTLNASNAGYNPMSIDNLFHTSTGSNSGSGVGPNPSTPSGDNINNPPVIPRKNPD